MKGTIRNLSNYIRALPLKDGKNEISVPYLSIYCSKAKMVPMPMVKSQYLYYIAEGSIRLHTPSGIMDYVAGQASVSSIDTPFCGEVLTTSADGEFVALIVEFTEEEVISVALSLEGDLTERIANGKIPQQTGSKAEKSITDCLLRLLKCCFEEDIRAFMAAQIKREILFYALLSAYGQHFLQSIVKISGAGEIYEINSWIKSNFRDNFTIEDLAKQGHMSVSSFHRKFKNAVGMGPLQCQKRLRLTEARRRMLNENASVTDAAMDVGYDSVSQFIRDYKKMFGHPPRDDILSLRRKFEE